jgi:hypothetical protein
MDVELRRHGVINRVEKAQELPAAVPPMTLANDASSRDIQRRKQRRRPVSYVIVRPALGLSWPHRQQRRGAIERLNLTLFIDR